MHTHAHTNTRTNTHTCTRTQTLLHVTQFFCLCVSCLIVLVCTRGGSFSVYVGGGVGREKSLTDYKYCYRYSGTSSWCIG